MTGLLILNLFQKLTYGILFDCHDLFSGQQQTPLVWFLPLCGLDFPTDGLNASSLQAQEIGYFGLNLGTSGL